MKHKGSNKIIIAIISLYLILPIIFTFIYSMFTEWDDILPKGFTGKYYTQMFTDENFLMSVFRTIYISILPVLTCTIAVLLVMYVVIAYIPRLDKYLQIICTIPYAIQGVIIAISVLSLYADAPDPISNRTVMLVSTYCIVVLPYMYRGIRNSLNTINANCLLEAANILGAGKLYAFFRIIVPNILPGITVSVMLSFSIIFGDFIVMNIIGGNYVETSQIYLYNAMKTSGQFASAIIVVLFVITLIISSSVFMIKSKSDKVQEGL